jgi:hypothetical protein
MAYPGASGQETVAAASQAAIAAAERALREARQHAAEELAERVLAAAEGAPGMPLAAQRELAAARRYLRWVSVGSARGAALALNAVSRAYGVCPPETVDYIRAAERAVRNVVVLRCCANMAPEAIGQSQGQAFIRAAEEAFGGKLELPLHSQMILAFNKIMGYSRQGPSRGPRRQQPPARGAPDEPMCPIVGSPATVSAAGGIAEAMDAIGLVKGVGDIRRS